MMIHRGLWKQETEDGKGEKDKENDKDTQMTMYFGGCEMINRRRDRENNNCRELQKEKIKQKKIYDNENN